MAKLSVDKDLLSKIANEAKDIEDQPKEPVIIARTVAPKEGEVLFSSVFWKPKTIPDIPVRVYKVEDWDEAARVMIPDVDKNWIWPKEATELFALAMYCDDTILLHGLQGTGKSELAAQWGAKFNMPVWRQSCHEQTREEHFLGSISVAYEEGEDGSHKMVIKQEPSLLTDSLRYGGIFVEDEAFRHSSALVLQSLREKNTRKLILPDAPGRTAEERVLKADRSKWRYVLTDNTRGSGDETGIFQAQVQDASTLDRITTSIEVDYLPAKAEAKILTSHNKEITPELAQKMVRFAELVRKSFKNLQLQSTISVRGLLSWAEKIALTGNVAVSLNISWASKLNEDNYAKVSDMFHQVFGERLK